MSRLTEKDYWNSVYLSGASAENIFSPETEKKLGLKGLLKRYLGQYWRDYSDYLEWDVLYQKYFPQEKNLRIIEIGSAPGSNLIRLHQTFDFTPYGVEYSEAGARLNREAFRENGIDPENVINADVFSPEFLSKYEGAFDVVISRGFIEHFTELDKVIDSHLTLLKDDGHLIITIPRLVGFPHLLFKFFNPDIIPMHNLKIMNRPAFKSLFNRAALKELYCNYYGTFKVQVCGTLQLQGWKLQLMYLLMNLQSLLNILFRIVFRDKGLESFLFSPYLIYIGKKSSLSPHR